MSSIQRKPRLRAANGKKTAEVWLYEPIGEALGGCSAKRFAAALAALGEVATIRLHLNSPGGDPFEAITICNALRFNPARVVIDVEGVALGAAAVVMMGGDLIRIAYNALVMIADPQAWATGSSEDIRDAAGLLDQVRDAMVETYVARTGATREHVSDLMTAETWMQAEDALVEGFVDDITPAVSAVLNLDAGQFGFRNMPRSVIDRASQPLCSTALSVRQPRLDAVRTQVRDLQQRVERVR